MMMQYKERGFTLVELIIVIAIMAILAAIAAPNYQSFMTQRRLNGAARQFMSDLMLARMQAVTQNNNFKVSFRNYHEYQILDDDNNNGTADTGEALVIKNIQTDYHDVTFSRIASPVFEPRGTAINTSATVTNPAGSKTISVNIAGRVKID